MRLIEYLDSRQVSPFAEWFGKIPPHAAAKVRTALARMELGNLSNVKGVGRGVLEYRIDYGPGYRIYLGRDGEELIILLAGGSKHRQQNDIEHAQARWQDYKMRKRKN